MNLWLARIAIWFLFGCVLNTLAADYTTWQFWCVMGLLYALEQTIHLSWIDDLQAAVKKQIHKEPNEH